MELRWLGAALVIAGCGGIGFAMALAYRAEEKTLSTLISVLNYMHCELEYRLTPLPVIFRSASKLFDSCVGKIFRDLADEMDRQISPDAKCCLEVVLKRRKHIPKQTEMMLRELGMLLGKFDLDGQIQELCAVRDRCINHLDMLSAQHEEKIRGYETLGLCAGAALAILLI